MHSSTSAIGSRGKRGRSPPSINNDQPATVLRPHGDLPPLPAEIWAAILEQTSLPEMKERDLLEWLTEAASLLGAALTPQQSTSPMLSPVESRVGFGTESINYALPNVEELKHLVIEVLRTMPWERLVDSTAFAQRTGLLPADSHLHVLRAPEDGSVEHTTTTASHSDASLYPDVARATSALATSTAVEHTSRWSLPLQQAFEMVCRVLVQPMRPTRRISHATLTGVLEVMMKVFHVLPIIQDGAQRVVPCDGVIRLFNEIATHYGSFYVVELLEKCVAGLMPKPRWPIRHHHLSSTAMILFMALENQIPPISASGGTRGVAEEKLRESAEVNQCLTHAYALVVQVNRSAPLSEMPHTALTRVAKSSPPLSSADQGTTANKLLACRLELLNFLLKQLRNVELSLEKTEAMLTRENMPFSPTSMRGRASSFSSFPSSAASPSSHDGSSFASTYIPSVGLSMTEQIRESSWNYANILRDCCALTYARLALDMRHQKELCTDLTFLPDWWDLLVSFHLQTLPRSSYLSYIAPSVALAQPSDCEDLMQRLVTAITTGVFHSSAAAATATAGGRLSGQAPHAAGGVPGIRSLRRVDAANLHQPSEKFFDHNQRIALALFLYPHFLLLRSKLGNCTTLRRRLVKWLGRSMSSHANLDASSHGGGGSGTLPRLHPLPTGVPSLLLIEVVFSQYVAMLDQLGVEIHDWTNDANTTEPELGASQSSLEVGRPLSGQESTTARGAKNEVRPPNVEVLKSPLKTLVAKYRIPTAEDEAKSSAVVKLDVRRMKREGYLVPALLSDCPWML